MVVSSSSSSSSNALEAFPDGTPISTSLAQCGGNKSQFYFTLDSTPELSQKNTLFGRVVGDTVFNLLRMGELQLDEEDSERPLFPPKILSIEVVDHPFDDLLLSAIETTSSASASAARKIVDSSKVPVAVKSSAVKKKRTNLLSFGDELDIASSSNDKRI